MSRWILRLLAWILGGFVAIMALLSGMIHLDQYVLRWRGERLEADIRSLELRKSTYADARRFEDRWLDDTKEGVCRPSWCDLQICLKNTGSRHLEFLLNHLAVRAVYHRLGGRVASVGSFLRVRDNLLWGKGISLGIETLSTESDGRYVEYELGGSVGTNDHFTWISARHPEYQIGGPTACTSCRVGGVNFTPFADPEDVSRLTDLNFACLTRWRHCTEQADILPTAWKELNAEIAERAETSPNPCTPVMIRNLSRPIHRVDLLRVIKLKPDPVLPFMTVHQLPGTTPQPPDQWPEFDLPADLIGLGPAHIGEQFLLFDDGPCRAVPATPENLATARLGAEEGWANPAHLWPLPVGTFKPPKIDLP